MSYLPRCATCKHEPTRCTFEAVAAFVIAVVCVAVVAATAAPSPWTDLDGRLYHRCDDTTGLYRMKNSDVVDAVPNDPRCAETRRDTP